MAKTKLMAIVVLGVLLLAPLLAVSAFAYSVPTFSLSQSTDILQYNLPQGTEFNGTVATTGSVRVWVSDPNMTQIVNLGIINKTTQFSFVAPKNGTYIVNFENGVQNSIEITFSFTTDPYINFDTGNSASQSLTYLIVTVVVAVVGSFVIILFLRRHGKA